MAAGPTLQRIRIQQTAPRINGNPGATGAVTFALACTPGSLIVGVLLEEDGSGLATMADPTNSTYAKDVSKSNTAGAAVASAYVFSKKNTAATALTVTATLSSAVSIDLTVFELLGCDPTAALDSTASANGAASTDLALSIATNSIDCAVFQTCSFQSGTPDPDSGFQTIYGQHGGTNIVYTAEYTLASGAARTINVDQGLGVQSSAWAAVAAAYKAGPVIITPARFGKVGYDPNEIIVPARSLAAGAIDSRYHPKLMLRGPPQ